MPSQYVNQQVVRTARAMLKALTQPGFVDFDDMDASLEPLRAALKLVEGQNSGFSVESVAVIAHAVRNITQYTLGASTSNIMQGLYTRYSAHKIPDRNTKLSHIANAGTASYEAELWSKLFQQVYRIPAVDTAA